MTKIKTFAKSNLNLRDWFVSVLDSSVKKPVAGDTYLTHKSQLKIHIPVTNADRIRVSDLEHDVISRIINEQSLRMTHIQLSNVPPPHPNFYSCVRENKLRILNANKNLMNI